VEGAPAAQPGAIVAVSRAGVDVATGSGVLRLRRIQPPSGRAMDVEAYLAAHSLAGASFVS
jgi:methionyl-tRNA formyltransferase